MSKVYRPTEYPGPDLQGEAWEMQMRRWSYYSNFQSAGFPQRHIDKHDVELTPEQKNNIQKILSLQPKGALCLLAGRRGCGKTQLGVILAIEWFERLKTQYSDKSAINVKTSVRYVKAVDLVREMTATWKKSADESEDDVMRRFMQPSLLVIDEIAELKGNDVDRSIFVNLIDHRYDKYKSTVIMGNVDAQQVSDVIDPSILSRMQECGGMIELKGGSFRA